MIKKARSVVTMEPNEPTSPCNNREPQLKFTDSDEFRSMALRSIPLLNNTEVPSHWSLYSRDMRPVNSRESNSTESRSIFTLPLGIDMERKSSDNINHPELRGMDSSAIRRSVYFKNSRSSVVPNISMIEQNDFQLGLEDAIGKGNNWLPNLETQEDKRPIGNTFEEHVAQSGGPVYELSDYQPLRFPAASAITRKFKQFSHRILGFRSNSDNKSPNHTNYTVLTEPLNQETSSTTKKSSIVGIKQIQDKIKSKYEAHHAFFGSDTIFEDISGDWGTPPTKQKRFHISNRSMEVEQIEETPLRLIGSSLKLFGPENKFRLWLYRLLQQHWIEQISFCLIIFQTILLTVESVPNIFENMTEDEQNNPDSVFINWSECTTSWCLLGIFISYSFIAAAKIVTYGLWDDSQKNRFSDKTEEYELRAYTSATSRSKNLQKRYMKHMPLVTTLTNLLPEKRQEAFSLKEANTIKVFEGYKYVSERAYLRSSWNRIQFLAIISYWISLLLEIHRVDINNDFFLFKLLSSLPILHLLNLTPGTSSVLHSLKSAAPLLVNICIFIGFFW